MRTCLFSIAIWFFISFAWSVMSQESADPYVLGATIVTSHEKSCPIFIDGVLPHSPAAAAGLAPGDRLLAVNGRPVTSPEAAQAAQMMRSDTPGSVVLSLWRKGRQFQIAVQREKWSSVLLRDRKKVVDHFIVPLDTTQAEVERMKEVDNGQRRIVNRIFPLHYPLNAELYFGGFEIFVYTAPTKVAVGGLERGPAARAGIHQGDIILSINGTDLSDKSPNELEKLFSSNRAKRVKLLVDRVGTTTTIQFTLAKVSSVLKENHRRIVNGVLVYDGLADEDIKCFVQDKN